MDIPRVLPEQVLVEIFHDLHDPTASHYLLKHQLLRASQGRVWSFWPPSISLSRSRLLGDLLVTCIQFSRSDDISNDDIWRVINDVIVVTKRVGNEGLAAIVLIDTGDEDGKALVTDFLSPWTWAKVPKPSGWTYIHRGGIRISADEEPTSASRRMFVYRAQTDFEQDAEKRIVYRLRGYTGALPSLVTIVGHVHRRIVVTRSVSTLLEAWPQLSTMGLLAYFETTALKRPYIPGPRLQEVAEECREQIHFHPTDSEGLMEVEAVFPCHLVVRCFRSAQVNRRLPAPFLTRNWQGGADHISKLLGSRVSFGLSQLLSNFLGMSNLNAISPENVLPYLVYANKHTAKRTAHFSGVLPLVREAANEKPLVDPTSVAMKMTTAQWTDEERQSLRLLNSWQQLAASFAELKAHVTEGSSQKLEDLQPLDAGLWMAVLRELHKSPPDSLELSDCEMAACAGPWKEEYMDIDPGVYDEMLKIVAGGDDEELRKVLAGNEEEVEDLEEVLREGLETQADVFEGLDFSGSRDDDMNEVIGKLKSMGLDVDEDSASEMGSSVDDDSSSRSEEEEEEEKNWLQELVAMNDDELSRTLEGFGAASSGAGKIVVNSGPGAFLLQELRRAAAGADASQKN